MSKKPSKPPQHRELVYVADAVGIHEEIDGESNRAAAITALAYIENNLVLAIMTRLRSLSADEQKIVFDDEIAPLRDFSAKVDMAFALNLYDDNVRQDLHRLRKIRNKFAHTLDVRDFDHPLISRYCDELTGTQRLDPPKRLRGRPLTRRERYVELAFHFATRFALETHQMHRPPASVNRIGADY